MPGNQAAVKHHVARQLEHNWLPGQVLEFPEGQQGMYWEPHIKGGTKTWDEDTIPIVC